MLPFLSFNRQSITALNYINGKLYVKRNDTFTRGLGQYLNNFLDYKICVFEHSGSLGYIYNPKIIYEESTKR